MPQRAQSADSLQRLHFQDPLSQGDLSTSPQVAVDTARSRLVPEGGPSEPRPQLHTSGRSKALPIGVSGS